MKTSRTKTFYNHLGISTNTLDERKGLVELTYMNQLVVAVSDNTRLQAEASERFRSVTSKSNSLLVSGVDLVQPGGSTIVPGVDVRVPVFSVYAGRLEDTYGTNGHRITNNRLLTIQKEMELLASGKHRVKTPYLSWLCKSMGVNRPRTLKDLQDLLIEAGNHPEAASVPAIHQLLVGRGTRHAILTVSPQVEYKDTEPVVNESDWMFYDLERLVMGGITDTQASVIRKTAEAFTAAIAKEAPAPAPAPAQQESKEMVMELLAA